MISENITQDQIKEIDSRVKEVRIDLAKQKDEEKILEGDLKRSLKAFYDSEGEYHKSHNDLEANKQSLERAESDGSFTRNEVEKLKLLVQSKTRHYDDTKVGKQEKFFIKLVCAGSVCKPTDEDKQDAGRALHNTVAQCSGPDPESKGRKL